jgi:phage terminase large subunit-like protein
LDYARDDARNCSTFTVLGLAPHLEQTGTLSHKHIPHGYLWAGTEQRALLLAGLLDSDGYAEGSKVEFCTTDLTLAEGVLHLARSLGQKPRLYKGRATLSGVDHGPKFRVVWQPTVNPFLLPRKRSKVRVNEGGQALRNHHRMIISAEPITPGPMRCITVDSPNSMFLVGEAMIPTHNSKSGSEWAVERVLRHPFDRHGVPTEGLVIAETLSDARTICMEGPAGILRALERRKIPHRYKMSPRPMVQFPDGAKIYCEGADDPDVGRGYNAAWAWLDEMAKWRYSYESWYEGIMPSLRADLVNDHPRAYVTTTPKPIKLLQEWIKRTDGTVSIVTGSTFENRANLSGLVLQELKKRYEGTTLGRQELYGEILEAIEGALFRRSDIERNRVMDVPDDLRTIIVGVDPSLTGDDDEMGCVVVGRDKGNDMYVLADRSISDAGRGAALHCWRIFAEYGADMLVVENNIGKQWMMQVFRDAYMELVGQGIFPVGSTPPLKGVDTKHGKKTRAEPVAMRYEQGRVHHVGFMPELEQQMGSYIPETGMDSPDRLDALVHACRFLMASERKQARISSPNDAPLPRVDAYMLDRLDASLASW